MNPKQMETTCGSVAVCVQKITSPLGIWSGWILVIFVAKQSGTCFQYEEPEGGGYQQKRSESIPPFPPSSCSFTEFSSSPAGLSWPPLLTRSISTAAVSHPCVHSEGVLTGHAGYSNMGGLCTLDIPDQGVSCVKTSLLRDTQQCDCAKMCSRVLHTKLSCRNTLHRGCSVHGSKPSVYTVSVL